MFPYEEASKQIHKILWDLFDCDNQIRIKKSEEEFNHNYALTMFGILFNRFEGI